MQNWEYRDYGLLYIEKGSNFRERPSRTITIMPYCQHHAVYSAQAALNGNEILDGVSNFYDGRFSRLWWIFVNEGSKGCTKGYKYWSSRAEITVEDWKRDKDNIMKWLWINNVSLVRSLVPLSHSALELVEEKKLPIGGKRYLYKLTDSVSRVFSIKIDHSKSDYENFDQTQETNFFIALDKKAITNINLDDYHSGSMEFYGSFNEQDLLLTSTNFHTGWTLLVDDAHVNEHIVKGPLGMLGVIPVEGYHKYRLVFQDDSWIAVVACVLLVLVLSFATVFYDDHQINGRNMVN